MTRTQGQAGRLQHARIGFATDVVGAYGLMNGGWLFAGGGLQPGAGMRVTLGDVSAVLNARQTGSHRTWRLGILAVGLKSFAVLQISKQRL